MEQKVIERIKNLNNKIKKELVNINFENINEAKKTIKNYSQLQIVFYLIKHRDDVVYQKDIGDAVHLKKSSITEHLDYLESIDVIKRIDDRDDSRKKRIILSQKAKEVETSFMQTISDLNTKILEGISEDELEVFMNVVDKIEKNIGDKK